MLLLLLFHGKENLLPIISIHQMFKWALVIYFKFLDKCDSVIMPQLLTSAILNKTFYLLFLILFLTAKKSDWIEVKKNIDLIK